MKQILSDRRRFLLLLLLNIGLAIYATPVTDLADTNAYIKFSRSFFENIPENFAHRSPLYSLLLGGMMIFFKPPFLFKLVVMLQYALLMMAAWMTYLIFTRLVSGKHTAFLIALLFNLSFATIFYANIIQTEILTVFLMMSALTLLLRIHDGGTDKQIMFYSVAVGLLALARYNTIPMVLTFACLLSLSFYRRKLAIGMAFRGFVIFLIPYLLIINSWCLYNKMHNNFYGLFPNSGGDISRNIVVASIRSDDLVSSANKPILDIFVHARSAYITSPREHSKGGFPEINRLELLTDLYGGYEIFSRARPELLNFFHLPGSAGEYELSLKLSGFYREIAEQNKAFILKYRFVSFLAGFLASSNGSLPASFGNINLNIFPAFLHRSYSLVFFSLSFFVFISFLFFIWNCFINNGQFDFTMMAVYAIIISFWGINFIFITANDAQRFKFPAEPLIIGMFMYNLSLLWTWAPWQRTSRPAGILSWKN